MHACAFIQKRRNHFIPTLQDTDRPHWHPLHLSILHLISEFKCVPVRKQWGCWPLLPRSLHSLHLLFVCDLLLYILLGTLHPVQPTDNVTESCCSSSVRVTKRLHWHCELTSPKVTSREILSAYPRWQLSTWSMPRTWGMLCSKIKEGITWMRFIHLNKVDHQSDVAAELLVRQRKKCRETERGEKRNRQA